MVGRGDDDGVNIVASQQFTKIGVGLSFHQSGVGFTAVLVSVGRGDALGPFALLKTSEQPTALSADADVANGDSFAGRRRVGVAQGG